MGGYQHLQPVGRMWAIDVFCAARVHLFVILCNPARLQKLSAIRKQRFVNVVSMWQYLSLRATVQHNEEHQIKN
jgi:hypothetical protein